jgi:hypothetical protein
MNKIKKRDLWYRYGPGSCIVCGQGTDTGFASEGKAEWHTATLIVKLGLPEKEASTLVSISTEMSPAPSATAGSFWATSCAVHARRRGEFG